MLESIVLIAIIPNRAGSVHRLINYCLKMFQLNATKCLLLRGKLAMPPRTFLRMIYTIGNNRGFIRENL